MTTYVLRFGASYASEIYYYLDESNFRAAIDVSRPLNVCSLGCGFAPDYFAIKKYLADNTVDIQINYLGLDKSTCWDFARPRTPECSFVTADLALPFSLKDADLVVINKVFSTLHRNKYGAIFLDNLQSAVVGSLRPGAILVFIDVNHIDYGRDVFHRSVSGYMNVLNQYYFDGYTGNRWTHLRQRNSVFGLPRDLLVEPHQTTRKTVVFDYRK